MKHYYVNNYKVIELTVQEFIKITNESNPKCDVCNYKFSSNDLIYFVPQLNSFFCKDCLDDVTKNIPHSKNQDDLDEENNNFNAIITKMKNILFTVTALLLASCSPIVLYDTQREAIVEDIVVNIQRPSKGKHIATAWSYKPIIKEYKIYTDYLYDIGDTIVIKGRK